MVDDFQRIRDGVCRRKPHMAESIERMVASIGVEETVKTLHAVYEAKLASASAELKAILTMLAVVKEAGLDIDDEKVEVLRTLSAFMRATNRV